MRLLAYLQSLAWCIFLVHGNVEKTIFLAPEAIQISQQHPNLEDLKLEVLSSSNPTLRRQLSAAFPKPTSPKGIAAWFLLDKLTQHQRYEVRICWAATVSLWTLMSHSSSSQSTFQGRWYRCWLDTDRVKIATNFLHTHHLPITRSFRHARANHFSR